MARASLHTVLHHLQTLAAAGAGEGQTDGDLLRAFTLRNGQAAFAALVTSAACPDYPERRREGGGADVP